MGDDDESEDKSTKDASTEMHTSILHNVIEPETFPFSNFSDLKSKLRSRNLLPQSQFPLTQQKCVNDDTKVQTEKTFKRAKLSVVSSSDTPVSILLEPDEGIENNKALDTAIADIFNIE